MKIQEKFRDKGRDLAVPEKIEDVVSELERLIPELHEILKQAQEKNQRIRLLADKIKAVEKKDDSFFAMPADGALVRRRYGFEGFFLLQTMVDSLEGIMAGKPPIDLLMNRPPWGWRL